MDSGEKLLDIGEKLDGHVLVGDGAVGTLLTDRGIEQPYTRANLTHPPVIRAVHQEYLRAGARDIETNTFSANRLEHAASDLEERVHEINVEGARLARGAVDALPRGEDAFVLGPVGPLGRLLASISTMLPDEAKDIFAEQAEVLLEGGADALLLETFTDLTELKLAYETVSALGAPVLAYKSFVEDGETLAELSKEDAPKYGVEVAQNLLIEAKSLVGGAYLMPPASMPHLAGDVIEPIV